MSTDVKIISKGRCQVVSEAELDELRTKRLSWFSYSHARLTRNHVDAVAHLTRHRRP